MAQKIKNTNIHSSHRQRLRNQVADFGFKSLSEVQAVEFLLYMTNAQKDTNPIAHDLLNKFGSLSAILDSTPSVLKSVDNIGDVTAQYLSVLPQIFKRYEESKFKNFVTLKNYDDIINYLVQKFHRAETEMVSAVFVNKSRTIKGYEILAVGEFSRVCFETTSIIKSMYEKNATEVIFAHNHPLGDPTPSKEDIDTNNRLVNIITNLGINVIDSLIIGNGSHYSFKLGQIIKSK